MKNFPPPPSNYKKKLDMDDKKSGKFFLYNEIENRIYYIQFIFIYNNIYVCVYGLFWRNIMINFFLIIWFFSDIQDEQD